MRVGGTYTVLGSTGGAEVLSIDRLLALELDVDGSTVTIHIRGKPVLATTDVSVPNPTRFTRRFERVPDPASVEKLRNAAEALRVKREDAFFGTALFSKEDAQAAVCRMNSAFEASKVFIPRG
jgi:hypothetical protein